MFQDATAMAEAIKKGQVSPLELVESSIARIEALNPQLNAVTVKQYAGARKLAQEGEFRYKPFGGVPILLKDLGQEQEGELSTSGSTLFANYRAQLTSNYTRKLEGLGFIILGRTNTPEFGLKNISDSRLHGPVNLPADLTRNAGGSSGGAAAAVASQMVPLAGASDGGGSIRIPASFNGLIGLKTSRGRIPVGPDSYRGWQGASVNFALTRSVRDTKRLLYQMQVCQMESPFPLPTLSEDSLFKSNLPAPLKIAVLTRSPIGGSVSEEAKDAVNHAARFLADQGHDIIELDRGPLDGLAAMRSYYLMNSVETAAMFERVEKGLGRSLSLSDMELMTWAIYQSGQTVSAKRYSQVLSEWDHYAATMSHFHKTYDILLTPTVADIAPKQGQFALSEELQFKLADMASFSMDEQQDLIWQMFEKSLDWTPFTQQANLTGQPAISLPTYHTEKGLALGVQLIADKGREDLLLNLASLFENHQQFQMPFSN